MKSSSQSNHHCRRQQWVCFVRHAEETTMHRQSPTSQLRSDPIQTPRFFNRYPIIVIVITFFLSIYKFICKLNIFFFFLQGLRLTYQNKLSMNVIDNTGV